MKKILSVMVVSILLFGNITKVYSQPTMTITNTTGCAVKVHLGTSNSGGGCGSIGMPNPLTVPGSGGSFYFSDVNDINGFGCSGSGVGWSACVTPGRFWDRGVVTNLPQSSFTNLTGTGCSGSTSGTISTPCGIINASWTENSTTHDVVLSIYP